MKDIQEALKLSWKTLLAYSSTSKQSKSSGTYN